MHFLYTCFYTEVQNKWSECGELDILPTITQESVKRKLSNLQTNKAPGPNDPHVKILKIFAGFFAIPLVDIFNESFRSRTFPKIWKNFSISAIPKVTPCLTVDELRPISLTSVISKLQESYVVNWMNEDIEGKITEAQILVAYRDPLPYMPLLTWYTNGVKQWITRIKSLESFSWISGKLLIL